MPRVEGTITDRAQRENKNGEPFLSFKVDVGRQYPVSITDHMMLGNEFRKGERVTWEIEESPGVFQGKSITYRNLVGVLDAPPAPAASAPQASRSEPEPESRDSQIDGMIWGAVGHDASMLLSGWATGMLGTEARPTYEALGQIASVYRELTQILYERRNHPLIEAPETPDSTPTTTQADNAPENGSESVQGGDSGLGDAEQRRAEFYRTISQRFGTTKLDVDRWVRENLAVSVEEEAPESLRAIYASFASAHEGQSQGGF